MPVPPEVGRFQGGAQTLMPKWGAAARSIRASGAAWKARVTGYSSFRHPRMMPAFLSAAVSPEPHASHDFQHHAAFLTAGRLPSLRICTHLHSEQSAAVSVFALHW